MRVFRRVVMLAGAALCGVQAANAQVQAKFVTIPDNPDGAPPPPHSVLDAAGFCTTNVGGSTTGFAIDFSDLAERQALATACGVDPNMFEHNFAVRFSGSLFTGVTANDYHIFLTTDDGNTLWINNALVNDSWHEQGGGPNDLYNVALNAGENPFLLDYYENDFGGANAFLLLRDERLVVTPPVTTTPEPASVALLATGLAGLAGVMRRRKG